MWRGGYGVDFQELGRKVSHKSRGHQLLQLITMEGPLTVTQGSKVQSLGRLAASPRAL